MGFIYSVKYIFQGNLPKTYSLTSWLRQQSELQMSGSLAAVGVECSMFRQLPDNEVAAT